VISNYLKGQPPSSFDLLHWNSDADADAGGQPFVLFGAVVTWRTGLSTGSMVLDQHPARSHQGQGAGLQSGDARGPYRAGGDRCCTGSQFFGGPGQYVLSASGHIAGVVNPPASGKYQYWTNGQHQGTSSSRIG